MTGAHDQAPGGNSDKPTALTTACVPGLAVAALSTIEGHRDAQRLLHALIGGCAPADLVLEALQQVEASGDAARLKGFCRVLQKQLEAGCAG